MIASLNGDVKLLALSPSPPHVKIAVLMESPAHCSSFVASSCIHLRVLC